MRDLLLFVALALVSWLLVYGVRRWAQRRQIFDIPNPRSSHSRPTPRGGGLAIVAVTLVVGEWYALTHALPRAVVAYLLGGLLIAVISGLDDLRSLDSRVRFGCHIVAALLVLAMLEPSLEIAGLTVPPWLVGSAFLVWIVALTNIYNFMDGIDGLAGSQAVVAAVWWIVISSLLHVAVVTMLALALAAGSVGFLLHNWPPARIFMGDVGSAFLGYSFAVFPLLHLQAGGQWTLLVGGVLSVWPFVFDGTLTIIRRVLRGENIFQAHRSHLYQRLVIQGRSHRAVSGLYTLYALISAACASIIVARGWHWSIIAVPLGLGVALFFWVQRLERQQARGYGMP